jgi:hypothetical protein
VLFTKCGVISDDEGFDFTGFLPGEDGDVDSEPQSTPQCTHLFFIY